MPKPITSSDQAPTDHPGLLSRALAVAVLDDFLTRSLPLDESFDRQSLIAPMDQLDDRDRSLARAIATVAIRRLGTIAKALEKRIEKGLPTHSGRLEAILIAGCAQILFLDVPDHAAVDLSIRLVQADADAKRFTALANAVLRRITRERAEIVTTSDPLTTDLPPWLANRWIRHYGETTARRIAAASRHEGTIDLTFRSETEKTSALFDGKRLPCGSFRLRDRVPIPSLPGFNEGAFWVQDAAAALPVKLLHPKKGERIADLCAAPGGKTAQLAAAGAHVIAVDRSEKRLERLKDNMQRLALPVETVMADATKWQAEPFDAVLIDAPCSATGTMRRHPDVAWLKSEEDLVKLASLQRRLLDHVADLLKPGGRALYCTCSLEPEEGEEQIHAFLARQTRLKLSPFGDDERAVLGPGLEAALTAEGFLRTLPFMLDDDDPRLSGIDGFFAARLIKI